MKLTAWLRTLMLVLACLGLLIPAPAMAAVAAPDKVTPGPHPQQIKAIDVELHKDGMLVGQVVNAQGIPQNKVPLSLIQGDKTLVKTATNRGGFFAVKEVPSGTYRVVADKTQGVYRLWANKTAPPNAQPGALLVVGQGPARGQTGPLAYWLGNPWIIGGLVAAAVAIPVAIHNHQVDNDTPASP
ncbi:MAG: carboxypeptidase regulatory-like domain-containing protein [Pirellulales bacterium]|nr:carboxypeptidase regulatory-like domain-containing protein [Pirellulales bacterium]